MEESTVNAKGKVIYGNPLLHDIHRIDWVKIEEVIVVKCLKGDGTQEDPMKAVYQGTFIGEIEDY